jgi:hypothetical protein
VRPLAMINFSDELYQENEKYVWVWQEEVPPRHPQPSPI